MSEVEAMPTGTLIRRALVTLTVSVVVLLGLVPHVTDLRGADHREAPLISEDPPADLADVFAFSNPNDPTKVVLALTVNGFAVPAVRSTYSFSNEVLYQFKIDNDGDGTEDLIIQAVFDGYESVRDPRCSESQGGQVVTLLGPAKPKKTGATNHLLHGKDVPVVSGCTNTILAAGGIRTWAGLRDDPFVVDIGQLNRILGGTQDVFRAFTSPALGALRGRPARTEGTRIDGFGGYNVSALVVEVPKTMVQGSRNRRGTYLKNDTTVGIWATTSRPGDGDDSHRGPFVQIQRNGHQVVKTVFIPTGMRDFFNASVPADDTKNFGHLVPDALTSNDRSGNTIAARAAVLGAVGVTALPNGVPLVLPADFVNTDKDLIRKVLLPDVLRLDLSIAPGVVAIGGNGYQNGRRLGDDVVDIVLRLARQLADVKFPDGSGLPGAGPVAGRNALNCSVLPACPDRRVLAVLQGTDFVEPDSQAEDVVQSGTDRPFLADFPFFGTPHPLPGADGTSGFPPQQ